MAKKDNNMVASDFNMITLNSAELESHLAASLDFGSNVTIIGRRGSGKTEISKQVVKEKGYNEVYLNMSVLERVDMGGYPNILGSKDSSFVNFILPDFYRMLLDESPNAKKCVVILDEVDKCQPDLYAPLLEFTQFKSINGRKLRNLQCSIMTGNLISEGGSRPSLPLLDRSEKYLLQPSVEKWLDWAGRSNTIHPSIRAYISDNADKLFADSDADHDDSYASPSPRGWANASKLVFAGEEHKVSERIILDKVSGCVGKQAGIQYKMYFHHYIELLPLVDKIFNRKDKKEFAKTIKDYERLDPSKKFVSLMILCSRLSTNLDKLKSEDKLMGDLIKANKAPEWLSNVGEFIVSDSVPVENTLVALRSQVQLQRFTDHSLDENESWGKILQKIHDALNPDRNTK